MNKIKPILIFIVVFIILLSTVWIVTNLSATQKQEEENLTETGNETASGDETAAGNEAASGDGGNQSLEDTIHAFAEVIYTYDTRERPYYEGAGQYMLKDAYEIILPLPADAGDEAGADTAVNVSSKLNEMTCYYREVDAKNVEILAEVWYSLSGTGDFKVRQIVKIAAVYQDEWKIKACTVLDTMEQ